MTLPRAQGGRLERAAALEALAQAFPPDRLVLDAERREAYGRD
jgi:hypothetical protein